VPAKGQRMSEEHKAALRAAQARRRERINAEKEAQRQPCACGCGTLAKPGNKFLSGHQHWRDGKPKPKKPAPAPDPEGSIDDRPKVDGRTRWGAERKAKARQARLDAGTPTMQDLRWRRAQERPVTSRCVRCGWTETGPTGTAAERFRKHACTAAA
jgi:hypothetical protein